MFFAPKKQNQPEKLKITLKLTKFVLRQIQIRILVFFRGIF
jgi:hypothetical protein